MRGLPGSGKTHYAKMIKDIETSYGVSCPSSCLPPLTHTSALLCWWGAALRAPARISWCQALLLLC